MARKWLELAPGKEARGPDYRRRKQRSGDGKRQRRSHAGRNSICEQGCGEDEPVGTAGLQAELLPMERFTALPDHESAKGI